MCGENNYEITVDQLLVGCSRFGLDSPCPIVTKRMSCFGNNDEFDKDFRRIIKKYMDKNKEGFEALKHLDHGFHETTDWKIKKIKVKKDKSVSQIHNFNETM